MVVLLFKGGSYGDKTRQSTKIDTHDNKWILSNLFLLIATWISNTLNSNIERVIFNMWSKQIHVCSRHMYIQYKFSFHSQVFVLRTLYIKHNNRYIFLHYQNTFTFLRIWKWKPFLKIWYCISLQNNVL